MTLNSRLFKSLSKKKPIGHESAFLVLQFSVSNCPFICPKLYQFGKYDILYTTGMCDEANQQKIEVVILS
uniref:Uncharacterized protein n=1 Tax=Onchocerca volvulus TaxID=6282 RepID=A0A8R1XU55_ONCVO